MVVPLRQGQLSSLISGRWQEMRTDARVLVLLLVLNIAMDVDGETIEPFFKIVKDGKRLSCVDQDYGHVKVSCGLCGIGREGNEEMYSCYCVVNVLMSLYWEARGIGESHVVGIVEKIAYHEYYGQMYAVDFKREQLLQGEYGLEMYYMFEDHRHAFAEYGLTQHDPYSVRFDSKDMFLIDGSVQRAVDTSRRCESFLEASQGYWKRNDEGWEWASLCSVERTREVCKRVYLIGDSHTKRWGQAMNMTGNSHMFTFQGIGGLTLRDDSPENDPNKYWRRWRILTDVIDHVRNDLEHPTEGYDYLVINSGHWDLRDLSLLDYVTDVKRAIELLLDLVSDLTDPPTIVWRSVFPFSYIHKPGDYSRDYRTNFKIIQANAEIKKLMQMSNIDYYDSWNFAASFWETPCDYHHYICFDDDLTTISGNNIGITDYEVFLGQLCNEVRS